MSGVVLHLPSSSDYSRPASVNAANRESYSLHNSSKLLQVGTKANILIHEHQLRRQLPVKLGRNFQSMRLGFLVGSRHGQRLHPTRVDFDGLALAVEGSDVDARSFRECIAPRQERTSIRQKNEHDTKSELGNSGAAIGWRHLQNASIIQSMTSFLLWKQVTSEERSRLAFTLGFGSFLRS